MRSNDAPGSLIISHKLRGIGVEIKEGKHYLLHQLLYDDMGISIHNPQKIVLIQHLLLIWLNKQYP
nr:MAG TPA: hypothetical protein [Caudoviricetes sp.]